MKQHAWLHTPQKGLTKPRIETIRKADSVDLSFPDVAEWQYLIDLLFEFGPVTSQGPISATDMRSFVECSGLAVNGEEFKMLVGLSTTYHVAVNNYANTSVPSPMRHKFDQSDIETGIDAALDALSETL